MRVTILGATGPVGAALLRRLADAGHEIVAVGRDAAKLGRLPAAVETRIADFADRGALTAALADARHVASCVNAAYLPALLGALPPAGIERLVVMGSTRRFSAASDPTATAVREAEAALATLALPSVLLLATMIYGTGRSVIDRLLRLGRFGVVPVPAGTLVQPIHVDDVAACLVAALFRMEAPGAPIVIAGPHPLAYAVTVQMTARARGRRVLTLPVPRLLLDAAGRLLAPSLRRLAENKAFDIADMRLRLAVEPRPFDPAA